MELAGTATKTNLTETSGLWVASRPELSFTPLYASRGRQSLRWTVFDPIARRSFRVGEVEKLILGRCRDFRPVSRLVGEIRSEEPSWELPELQRIVLGLIANGLIRHRDVPECPDSESRLHPRATTAKSDSARSLTNGTINSAAAGITTQKQDQSAAAKAPRSGNGLAGLLSSSIVWQVRGINPDRCLQRVAPMFGFLYSKAAVVCWLVFAFATWIAVCLDFHRLSLLSSQVSWFGSIERTGGLFIVFLLTRGLHELGHAVVCRRMGIRCPDVGFLVILGAPCLYCDVTECAKLPSRFQRAAVAGAGMYTELVLASVCAWGWLATDAGPINTLALQVMMVCSISTLLINANPLMRFDGYYILADWLDEVNLRGKADRGLASLMLQIVSGSRAGSEAVSRKSEPDSRRRQIFLHVFSAAGWVYRSMLTLAIASTVYFIFDSWNLPWPGRALALAIVFSWWGLPVIRFFRKAAMTAWQEKRPLRPLVGFIVIALAFGLLPLPMRQFASGKVAPKTAVTIYTDSASVLAAIGATDGELVTEGQLLFKMKSTSARQRYVSRVADYENSKIRLVSARHRRNMHMEDIDLRPLKEQTSMLGQLAEHTASEIARLEICSPASGIFVANESLRPAGGEGSLNIPDGSQWAERLQLGRTVPAGTALGQVCSRQAVAIVPLTDSQLRHIATGTLAKLRVPGAPPRVFSGEVTRVIDLSNGITATASIVGANAAGDGNAGPGPSRYAAVIPLVDVGEQETPFLRQMDVDVVFHCEARTLLQISSEWAYRHLRLVGN